MLDALGSLQEDQRGAHSLKIKRSTFALEEDQRGAHSHIRLEPEVNLQSGASLAKYERFHG